MKDLLKEAIAEAKTIREAAIANAKEALEETLTPHLKEMLAARLQEMEDSESEETVVAEEEGAEEESIEEAADSGFKKVTVKKAKTVKEAEEESEEDEEEEEVEGEEEEEVEGEEEEEVEGEEEADEDLELSKLTVGEFKELIRDIVAQEMGAPEGEPEMGADMDAGEELPAELPAEVPTEEPAGEGEPAMEPEMPEDEEEINLEELLRELDTLNDPRDQEERGKMNPDNGQLEEDLKEALNTIKTLKSQLAEVNLLNAKLLYVSKVLKANRLTESQKVDVISVFDKAETVKEVKLVYESVSNSIRNQQKSTVKEHKAVGSASKAIQTTAVKQNIINEDATVLRWQKLAGIIKD